ncbi:MAG: TRAP transporter small permease [Synergistota bacterium]|nr:TRAP transporter small permease [Synergistota bacterium]
MGDRVLRIRKIIVRLIDFTGCSLLLSIALLVFYQVIMRKVFNSPLGWVEEIVRIFLVWISFLGSYVALHNKQHLLMSLIIDKLTEKKKRILSLITNSMVLTLLLVVVVYGADFINQMGNIQMPVTGIKNFYVFGVMWISLFLMLLETIFEEYHLISNMRNGR